MITSQPSMRSARRQRTWSFVLLALLILLATDYALYPILSRPGGRSFNHGENGLWLRYPWYFGRHTDTEVRQLARRLREHQIRFAYFHVRHITREGRLRYHSPHEARRLVAALHHDAPGVQALAWVFAGNTRVASTGVGEVDLSRPTVRRAMVAEARWLVNHCGLDGVQWDYEICDSGDADFFRLMRETRAVLPAGKLLSVATPVWVPAPFRRWGWSDADFARLAPLCDQMAVMCYDSGLYLPRAYVWLVHQQAVHVTRAVARSNPRCRVLLGLPTYARGGLSHHAWSENLRLALKGAREGMADPRARPSVFAGVAPFADYTTQSEEWEIYRALWRNGS